MKKLNWHAMLLEEVKEQLQTNTIKGLQEKEAVRRLEVVGLNTLKEQKKTSPIVMFLSQFKDFMVLVLIAATLISGLLGEYADAITILAIIILNAILGFFQEYRAEKSLDALKKMIAPEAKVKREGEIKKVPAENLVPGDIVLLETGDIIPADLRLLDANQLEVSEAALTGESLPVKKKPFETYHKEIPLGDRKNMCYMGTVVTRGNGVGMVVDTGMFTEMGQIAGYIQEVQEEATPLQRRLAHLGKWLVISCLFIVAIVAAAGVLRGEPVYKMVLTGVSLAVAAIPEGLPAIVTIALAIGVQKMIKKQAIVRALPAVETLGCATIICSDKTGTLTQNEMTVKKLFISGEEISVEGEGYEPKGKFNFPKEKNWYEKNSASWQQVLKISALCNNASLNKNKTRVAGLFRGKDEEEKGWHITGDPTEGALLVLAAKGGAWREGLEHKEKRVYEIPFDSERKLMSVVYARENNKDWVNYCKGAPDVVLELCDRIYWQGEVVPLTRDIKEAVQKANDHMASKALRVLGLAYKEIPHSSSLENEREMEKELIFVALAGMIDPPRISAKKAVEVCKAAGIKTVMITGDHKITACAVAKELRILSDDKQKVLTGIDLDSMTDYQLEKIINNVKVYARVSPKHKIRIVRALKNAGNIVAMTGDGVNDAPAVKEADIGVSMGITGTDVTKEASSLILANDDFATIVSAVEEGRIIYDNIRKFIKYLLSCNVGEVLTMFFATILGLPLPLIPIQILWMNLVTDGLPAIALGLDPGDPDIMYRRPRSPKESIFSHGLPRIILQRGLLFTLITLLVYIIGYYTGGKNLLLARTMAFSTIVFAQLFYVFECRSEHYSVFQLGLMTNPYLVLAVFCSILMQLMVIYVPFFQIIFKTVPLETWHWLLILGLTAGTTLLQGFLQAVKIRRKRKMSYFDV